MTIDQLVDLVAARLLARARATADATDGAGQIEAASRDPRPCVHGALPGFSSGITADDDLFIVRRRDGSISVASLAHAPGEQAGDRTIWTGDGLTLRLRGKVLEVTGSDALDGIKLDGDVKVARDGDDCSRNVEMIAWMTKVETVCNALVPGYVTPFVGPSVADVVATTTKVKAG
jgi:hypothetical protein